MSIFEFVLGFVSIITSLALTHLIIGLVGLIRNAGRVKFSLVHAGWFFAAFASTIANWASAWDLRSMTDFPNWSVLLLVLVTLARYAFCAFVTPEIAPAGKIDLAAFHQQEGPRYLTALLVTLILAQAVNFSYGAADFFDNSLRDSMLALASVAAVLLGLLVRAQWAQLLAVAIVVSAYSYYLSVATDLIG
jgi:hypothetical protein